MAMFGFCKKSKAQQKRANNKSQEKGRVTRLLRKLEEEDEVRKAKRLSDWAN